MKEKGTLYGIGIGPGDPDLITVKGANILKSSTLVFVPISRIAEESVAFDIAERHINKDAVIKRIVFPMTKDKKALKQSWIRNAEEIVSLLGGGGSAAFITLGDPLFYSTYIYLIRAIAEIDPGIDIVTIPGINAFSAAAALTNSPVGHAKVPVAIIPSIENLELLRKEIAGEKSIVIMKIGKRLHDILDILESEGVIDRALMVSRAGMADQRIFYDLKTLKGSNEQTGYLSIIIIPRPLEE